MHSEAIRRAVRAGYVHDALTLPAAAARASVPEGTARKWKARAKAEGDDWDKARAANRMAGTGIEAVSAAVVEEFVTLFQSTIAELKAAQNVPPTEKAETITRLADAFAKTVRAAGMADPKLGRLAVAMEVLEHLGDFIRKAYPQHAAAFVEILEPYGMELAKRYG